MKKYEGMSVLDWCRLDIKDERKINYTLSGLWEGKIQPPTSFTSDDLMGSMWLLRLQRATITKCELINDEWFITATC